MKLKFQKDINGIFVWNPYPDECQKIEWKGESKDLIASGEGKLILYLNDRIHAVFTGEMKVGKPNDFGKFFYPNGDIYEGEWKNGQRHGIGKFYSKEGVCYEGNWFYDNLEKLIPNNG